MTNLSESDLKKIEDLQKEIKKLKKDIKILYKISIQHMNSNNKTNSDLMTLQTIPK